MILSPLPAVASQANFNAAQASRSPPQVAAGDLLATQFGQLSGRLLAVPDHLQLRAALFSRG